MVDEIFLLYSVVGKWCSYNFDYIDNPTDHEKFKGMSQTSALMKYKEEDKNFAGLISDVEIDHLNKTIFDNYPMIDMF